MDVQLLNRLFQKAYGRAFFRTDKDVREIKQQRVCPANSSLNSVHGCTLFNSLFQKAYEKLYTTCGYWESSTYQNRHGRRWFQAKASLHEQTCSPRMYRTYILGRGCRWFHAVAMFLRSKNSRSKIDKEVNF